jgi:two-component system, LuxR family, response regulator FixJ
MASENARAQRVVHVIDDDEGLRESLAFLLRSAELEVRSFDSAKGFLKVLPDATLGCVVTDVRMPDMSGIELLRRLKELKVGVPVIVITGHGDIALAVEAMKIGAADFFEKPFNDDLLVASVRAALRQQADQTKRGAERADIQHRISTLSPREKDVLSGLIDGRANKQIAFELGISPRTVEIYRANLMNKMHAGSLSDLVRMALLIGMLGSTEPGER